MSTLLRNATSSFGEISSHAAGVLHALLGISGPEDVERLAKIKFDPFEVQSAFYVPCCLDAVVILLIYVDVGAKNRRPGQDVIRSRPI